MTDLEAAIEAAASELIGEDSGYCGPGYGTCGSTRIQADYAREVARVAVEAAYPIIAASVEAATREAIAAQLDEIEARYRANLNHLLAIPGKWERWYTDESRLPADAFREAARIARSAVPEGSDK